jgi:hypothetical protein
MQADMMCVAPMSAFYLTASAIEEWSSQGVPNSILVPKPFASAQLLTALSNLLKRSM